MKIATIYFLMKCKWVEGFEKVVNSLHAKMLLNHHWLEFQSPIGRVGSSPYRAFLFD